MTKLTLIDRAFFLKKISLFSSLNLDLLLAIADRLQIVTFEPGNIVFRIGEEAMHMYFIVTGKVEIRGPNQEKLTLFDAGEFFGDESIFSEKPRAYDAVAQTSATLLALSKTNLLTIISECPQVAVGFLQTYTSITPIRIKRRAE